MLDDPSVVMMRVFRILFLCLGSALLAAWSSAAAAQCRIMPIGLIAERWNELDGAAGPLGCPTTPEFKVPGPKALPNDTTDATLAIASHGGRLFLAWKGAGNDNIKLMWSNDGIGFSAPVTLPETTDAAPALASFNGRLYLAWKGSGNENINVAKVTFFASTAGAFGVESLEGKVTLGDTTEVAPALAAHAGRLFLAFKGAGNDALNLLFSSDGTTFGGKRTFDESSDHAPTLASTPGGLLLGWKGSGNEAINVARVTLIGNTAGGFGIEGLAQKVTLGNETTEEAPALAAHDGRVFLAFKGAGNDALNMMVSGDGGASFQAKRILGDASDRAPALASHGGRLWLAWKGSGNEHLNLARAILIGNTAGGFGIEGLEGRDAIKMRFENGEVVWSPAQGSRMVVAGYQQDDNLILNWGDTAPFDYDKFIVRWDRDGRNIGQADVSEYIDRTNGFFRIQAPLPARYSLVVEGCNTGVGGSNCAEGWTVPVDVEYRLPELPAYAGCPPEAQPFGLIGERWAQMGGTEGPLGCPLAREHPVAGRPGAAQSFRNGEISFSPQQGEQMLLAVHLAGSEIVADWGSTGPFSYDKFILRLDKDGTNILQTDVGEGTGGHWSTAASGPGTYTVIVEGCDTGIGGSDCPQSWTIPASVVVPIPSPPPPAQPPGATCGELQPVGLIRDRWIALRADAGPMGCPIEAEHDVTGRRGRAMKFANGEIVWSPDQGDAMVVAVYQEGNGIVVDYGNSAPFTYVWFIVRVDYEGRNVGQIDVTGARGGRYVVGPTRPEDEPEVPTVGSGTGIYSIIVEGCEDASGVPPFDTATCEQGWTIPASVFFRTGNDAADFSGLEVPKTVTDALRDKSERARRAAQVMADRANLGGDWGDGQTTNALAMLYLIDNHVAAGQLAKSLRRFGRRFGILTEIENAVRVQKVYARSGTTVEGIPGCNRTGEYDTAMKGYIALLYRYGRLLAPDVRYRMLRLINQTGPHNPDLSSFGCFGVITPETENHLWMIDSSRFLANQLWAKRSADPRFNNRQNGLADYLIRQLQGHLSKDFIEYNSRPYSRYTWMAIQNLYDYSEDPGVKTAAQAVLDYLSAKAAVSMSDGRRNPPYRRRASNNHADFFNPQSDRLKKRFLVYTGPTRVMGELLQPNHVEDFAVSEILLAAATTYQPPNFILDLMVNASSRSYYQRFSLASGEAYAAEPDFLISAGGTPTDYAYIVVGTGKDEDLGVVQPTTLIPTGEITTGSRMIRFAGTSSQIADPAGLCVAPGFACGRQPTIPPRYTAKTTCVLMRERWTFIDAATDACKDPAHQEFGFYAAVFGAGTDFGLLEAVPKGKLAGVSLQRFADVTMDHNRDRSFNARGENRYTAFGGNEIRFNIGNSNPIGSTGNAAMDAIFRNGSGLATGTVLNTSRGAAMTIRNPSTGDTLALDLNDPANPIRTLVENDPLSRLLGVGIDFSVPEPDIRDWVVNSFTPYPALSGALDELLKGTGLRNLVFIDVVAFNYEAQPGATSPRSVAEVDRERLKAAIVEGYNTRYGTSVRRFEDVLR